MDTKNVKETVETKTVWESFRHWSSGKEKDKSSHYTKLPILSPGTSFYSPTHRSQRSRYFTYSYLKYWEILKTFYAFNAIYNSFHGSCVILELVGLDNS